MSNRLLQALLQRSIPSELAQRIVEQKHSISFLRASLKKDLKKFYVSDDVELIKSKIDRKPISKTVLNDVIERVGASCAYCADGDPSKPFQIHHIEFYSKTQDNEAENLFLLCPTHHVSVHKKKISSLDQKLKRTEWESYISIYREFKKRGIVFSFQAWEILSYERRYQAIDCLSLGELSPSFAKKFFQSGVGLSYSEKLQEKNFILFAGRSGSGKSTLMVGIAGVSSESENRIVMRYRRPTDTRRSISEILTLMTVVEQPVVLLIDDINTWAEPSDIEEIKKASGPNVQVIASCTRESIEDFGPWEYLLGKELVEVHWELLKADVKKFLMENEVLITNKLKELRPKGGVFEDLGIGSLGRDLQRLISDCEKGIQTIQQFMFALKGDLTQLTSAYSALAADNRSDIPLLFAAVEQIAGVESPISVEQVKECYAATSFIGDIPSLRWIEKVFLSLTSKRIMVRVRDSFTTVHRSIALSILAEALWNPLSKLDAERILLKNLDLKTENPRRILILWSWLRSDGRTRGLLNKWLSRQGVSDWVQFVKRCAQSGVTDLGWIFENLHVMSLSEPSDSAKGRVIDECREEILEALQKAGSNDWWALDRISCAFRYSNSVERIGILEKWTPKAIADVINETHPKFYKLVSSFLYSMGEFNQDWLTEVGGNLDWEKIEANLYKPEIGDVDSVVHLLRMFQLTEYPLSLPQLSSAVKGTSLAMKGAKLSDMQLFDIMMPGPLYYFPEELEVLLSEIDLDGVAEELSRSVPRDWKKFAELAQLCNIMGLPISDNILDKTDDRFIDRVNELADQDPYDLRVLLWGIITGGSGRKDKFIRRIRPGILKAARKSESEMKEILKALHAFSSKFAFVIAGELKCPMPEIEIRERDIRKNKLEIFKQSSRKAKIKNKTDLVFDYLKLIKEE